MKDKKMKILVLGGCGIQGRTVLYDLAADPDIAQIICADIRFDELEKIKPFVDMDKITTVTVDARQKEQLIELYRKVDIVIDLLPANFKEAVYDAALDARVDIVNSNYAHETRKLDARAKEAGITIMPECGLDPGIDLILYGDAARRFDQLHVINSYCGGFPERNACTNPLNYKVSWIWRGVLNSIMREGRIIKDGKVIDIPAMNQHDEAFIHTVDFPGLGLLEAIPNGDAVTFTDLLGVTDTIVESGRYSLRWRGWSDFWRPLKALGFLSDEPVKGLGTVTPIDFLDKLIGPQLAYRDDEKDLVTMINIFEGIKEGKKTRMTSSMLIERDLDTGIMAMSKGVGFTAAIVARMILKGKIKEKGVLSPLHHIPVAPFITGLKERGIQINEETLVLE